MTQSTITPAEDRQRSKLNLTRPHSLGLMLGTIISLVCLVLVFRDINLGEVSTVLRQADLQLLALGLVAALINYVALATRWGLLFYPHYRPRLIHLFGAQVVGQLVNTILPGRLSPLARVGWLATYDADISTTFALSVVVIEKILDGVIYLLLLLVVLASMPLPEGVRDAGLAAGMVSTVLAGLVLGAVMAKPQLTNILRQLGNYFPSLNRLMVVPLAESALNSLDIWRYPRQGLQVVAWSGVVWGSTAMLYYVVVHAMRLNVPFIAAIVLLIFIQAGLRIASVPGGIGVFHYLCIVALSLFDVSRDAALGYAIVLHLLNFLPQSLLGIVFVWQARNRFGDWFPRQLFPIAKERSEERSV